MLLSPAGILEIIIVEAVRIASSAILLTLRRRRHVVAVHRGEDGIVIARYRDHRILEVVDDGRSEPFLVPCPFAYLDTPDVVSPGLFIRGEQSDHLPGEVHDAVEDPFDNVGVGPIDDKVGEKVETHEGIHQHSSEQRIGIVHEDEEVDEIRLLVLESLFEIVASDDNVGVAVRAGVVIIVLLLVELLAHDPVDLIQILAEYGDVQIVVPGDDPAVPYCAYRGTECGVVGDLVPVQYGRYVLIGVQQDPVVVRHLSHLSLNRYIMFF